MALAPEVDEISLAIVPLERAVLQSLFSFGASLLKVSGETVVCVLIFFNGGEVFKFPAKVKILVVGEEGLVLLRLIDSGLLEAFLLGRVKSADSDKPSLFVSSSPRHLSTCLLIACCEKDLPQTGHWTNLDSTLDIIKSACIKLKSACIERLSSFYRGL